LETAEYLDPLDGALELRRAREGLLLAKSLVRARCVVDSVMSPFVSDAACLVLEFVATTGATAYVTM
jgi:hypothetical protein